LTISADTKVTKSICYSGDIFCSTDAGEENKGKSTEVAFLSFLKKRTLKFNKGILIAVDGEIAGENDDDSLPGVNKENKDAFLQSTGTGTQWTKLGALAFYDTITLSSAFRIGSSGSYTNVTPTLDGDTATFTVKVSGEKAGYSETVYMLKNSSGDYKLSKNGASGDWEVVDSTSAGGSGTTSDQTVYCKVVVSPKKNTK
jgi:hypothetical protein